MYNRLYLHIPFCRRKCPYCAFVSMEATGAVPDAYVDLLLLEMELAAERHKPGQLFDSLYLGGGTPSLLRPGQLAMLLEKADRIFTLAQGAEITIEANPGTVDRTRLSGFRSAGVNRLSLGIQSFHDHLLKVLGRIHASAEAEEAFFDARAAGFDNIGIDLIHTLPGQTEHMWQKDLERAVLLAPEHISVYGLTVEEGTPFAERQSSGISLQPDDDLSAAMFEAADNLLCSQGYEHYEIANYARPGLRSRHNSGYWHRDGCLGLGVGAHSFLRIGRGVRYANPASLDEYALAVTQGSLHDQENYRLTGEDAMAEYLFLGLRMSDGVTLEGFEHEFGVGLHDRFGSVIPDLKDQGLITIEDGTIRLTRRGMLLSNQVFMQFLP